VQSSKKLDDLVRVDQRVQRTEGEANCTVRRECVALDEKMEHRRARRDMRRERRSRKFVRGPKEPLGESQIASMKGGADRSTGEAPPIFGISTLLCGAP
jgi:hypothetical protein